MPDSDINAKDISKMKEEIRILKKDLKDVKKLAVNTVKENLIIKKQMQLIITRIINNENQLGHLNSKR